MSPIRVETGPMFSRKSGTLVDDIECRVIGRQVQGVDFLVFNHASDERYGKKVLATHRGVKITAVAIASSEELLHFLFDLSKKVPQIRPEYRNLRALYLDEAQFFDEYMGKALQFIDEYFTRVGTHQFEVIVAGLDQDFRGEPFGPMSDILARAHTVHKHMAVCSECGDKNATKTQRLIDGIPANYDDPIILVDAKDSYTARCDKHHEVPGKNKFKNGHPLSDITKGRIEGVVGSQA